MFTCSDCVKTVLILSFSLFVVACQSDGLSDAVPSAPAQVELVLTITGDPNPLNGPTDIDVDADGKIYVVDSENDRVQVFDGQGRFVNLWGGLGDQFGQFNFNGTDDSGLGSITSSPLGNLFVADTRNRRIQRFGSDGRFITAWGAINPEGTQFFATLFGVASDRHGDVYAIDAQRNEIVRFSAEGDLVGRWGSRGTGDGQLDGPSYIVVDTSDRLYVADWGNNRIQVFDTQGVFLAKWGSAGSEDGQFNGPNDVAVASDGTVYVADSGNDRIQAFDEEGRFLFAWGSRGPGDYEFDDPYAVVVDRGGRIYVADYMNDRVQVFVRR